MPRHVKRELDLSAAQVAAPRQLSARQLEKYQAGYRRAQRLLQEWLTKSYRANNAVKKYQKEAARLEKLLR